MSKSLLFMVRRIVVEIVDAARLTKLWYWRKIQATVWFSHASRDQLDQIIWRLEMNEGHCPVDTKAALNLARMLRKRVGETDGR